MISYSLILELNIIIENTGPYHLNSDLILWYQLDLFKCLDI